MSLRIQQPPQLVICGETLLTWLPDDEAHDRYPQGREVPFSGGRAVEGGTPFAFQLDKDGKPAQPFGAYKRLDNGARIVVLGEGMATLFLGTPNGVRLTGVPKDPTRTTYWGKDSAIFMEELLMWLSR